MYVITSTSTKGVGPVGRRPLGCRGAADGLSFCFYFSFFLCLSVLFPFLFSFLSFSLSFSVPFLSFFLSFSFLFFMSSRVNFFVECGLTFSFFFFCLFLLLFSGGGAGWIERATLIPDVVGGPGSVDF